MSQVHSIRLRGPWELMPLVDARAAQTITQQLPAAWDDVLPGFRGTVRYTRRFGKPTNLEAHERVWLCLDDVAGSAVLQLNGELLTGALVDVTDLLRERNLLQVDVTQTDSTQPAGLVGEVRLEIRVADSLRESEPVRR